MLGKGAKAMGKCLQFNTVYFSENLQHLCFFSFRLQQKQLSFLLHFSIMLPFLPQVCILQEVSYETVCSDVISMTYFLD